MNKKQQYVLGAILFVFAFSFSFNEFIKLNRSEIDRDQSRAVASFEDRVATQSEINWEHELAKSLHHQGHDARLLKSPPLWINWYLELCKANTILNLQKVTSKPFV